MVAQTVKLERVRLSIVKTGNDRQAARAPGTDEIAENPSITPDGTDIPQLATQDDLLGYIEDMAAELREMAAQNGFEALSCILDIAHREAQLRRAE